MWEFPAVVGAYFMQYFDCLMISKWSVLIWWLYDSFIKYERNFFIQANQIQAVGMKYSAYFMQNVMFTFKRLEN